MMGYLKAIVKFDLVDKGGQVVPFIPNKEQEKLLGEMTGKDVILKSRQIGFSSLILALFTIDFLTKENSRSVVISHETKSTQRLLDKVKFFLDSCEKKGLALNLKYSSRNELVNSNKNSTFYLGTAGAKAFGRGDTIDDLLLSEFAFYPEPEIMLASVLQAVVPGGKVFIESTANGINFFKGFWEKSKRGETGFKTHFFDNSFYSPEFLKQKRMELGDRLFKQEYPTNDVECFLYSGDPFFDMTILKEYLEKSTEPINRGGFVGLNPPVFEESDTGYWSIWEMPKEGHNYILSADVAERRDYCAGSILDRFSFKVVASFHGHLEASLFGNELAMAGKYYNEALIAVEKNNQGLAVLQRLRDLYYPRLYQRKVIDSVTQNEATDLGWLTSSKTRPLMLANLQSVIRQKTLNILDKETIKEMMSFARNDQGKPEALQGSFDDRVIALAIAAQVYGEAPQQNIDNFDQALWDQAQDEERKRLGVDGFY